MTDRELPGAILFVCQLNSIRSPIAEGLMKRHVGKDIYVQSCGISASDVDDLMVAVMSEKGIDMAHHTSRSLHDLCDGSFDLVIAFTPEAEQAARAYFDGADVDFELWDAPDPTKGSLDVRAMMNNYRALRDNIEARIKRRFII